MKTIFMVIACVFAMPAFADSLGLAAPGDSIGIGRGPQGPGNPGYGGPGFPGNPGFRRSETECVAVNRIGQRFVARDQFLQRAAADALGQCRRYSNRFLSRSCQVRDCRQAQNGRDGGDGRDGRNGR